jgi:hypothetical protein
VLPIRAMLDPALRARIITRHALYYTHPVSDAPLFVRAASSISWFGERLAIVQDDTLLIALVDPQSFEVEAIALPLRQDGARTFDVAQGNKKQKADFEASVSSTLDGTETLFAFGSGSHENRESIAIIRQHATSFESSIVHAPALYAALRAERGFLSSELNLEGALLVGDTLRLFQRSNGTQLAADTPVCCATCDLSWSGLLAYLAAPAASQVPALRDVQHYDLGKAEDARLTFTDAALLPDGSVAFSASAESSPNAYDDGVVTGSALGKLAPGKAFLCPLVDEQGTPVRDKVEGLVVARGTASGPARRAYLVFDPDDHRVAATLAEVELSGF